MNAATRTSKLRWVRVLTEAIKGVIAGLLFCLAMELATDGAVGSSWATYLLAAVIGAVLCVFFNLREVMFGPSESPRL